MGALCQPVDQPALDFKKDNHHESNYPLNIQSATRIYIDAEQAYNWSRIDSIVNMCRLRLKLQQKAPT